jgi:hypothetical protein
MVGKEEYLGAGGKVGQQIQRSSTAFVIEVYEDVVGYEWQRLSSGAVIGEAGQTESEEELVARTIAHGRDGLGAAGAGA